MRPSPSPSKKTPWTRGDIIGVAALILTILGLILALTQPEVRRFIGLDRPASTQGPTDLPSTTPMTPGPTSITGTRPTNTPTSTVTTLLNPVLDPTLPLALQCIQTCDGSITVLLKNITLDTSTGKYEWSFFITNKVGISCANDFFTQLYLTLPDNTQIQPITLLDHDHWSMDINQTIEQDIFFMNIQSNVRYTLHMGINYCYNNVYDINVYRTYDFHFK